MKQYIKPKAPSRSSYPNITELTLSLPDDELDLSVIDAYVDEEVKKLLPFHIVIKPFGTKKIRAERDWEEPTRVYLEVSDGLAIVNEDKFKELEDNYSKLLAAWNVQKAEEKKEAEEEEYKSYLKLKKKFEEVDNLKE